MADIEATLKPNSYRLRHLADNDRHFDYTIPPDKHSGGCYEIELVIEKIASPEWSIATLREQTQRTSDFDPIDAASTEDVVRERTAAMPKVEVLPVLPFDVTLYDFAYSRPARRRILALQLGHFGDFIIGLPALRQLRGAFPTDHIRLVTGTWSRDAAKACGLVDEVVTHDHFPEVARAWNGTPVQSVDEFKHAVSGCFDIALDLRVDDDTRHLLQHVNAGTRCGIGTVARFPYLDVALPFDQSARGTDSTERSLNILLGPERFSSRMPIQSTFRHETDFSINGTHVIYGPYLRLPLGRFRATFGLQLNGMRFGRWSLRVKLDVVQSGSVVLAEQEYTAGQISEAISDKLQLEFTNADDQATCEFRVHTRGRALRSTMAFSGVRIDQLLAPATSRLRRADLHIGEMQSLLVQLLADRTRLLYEASDLDLPKQSESPSRYRFVVAPASNSDLRDWPPEHYVTLIQKLVKELECEVLLIGSRSQSGILGHIAQASGAGKRVTNLAGSTSWEDLPAILREADLVICNNSGVAHLAASLGRRTLAIYSASHQPQEWGPRGAQSRALMAVVPCSPCGYDRLSDCPYDHACMQKLMPETVFGQVERWLGVT